MPFLFASHGIHQLLSAPWMTLQGEHTRELKLALHYTKCFFFFFFTLDSGKYLWPNEKKLQRTPYVSKTSPLFPMALARDVASDANFDRIVILLKKWPSYTLHCCKSRAAGCQYNLQHNYISKKHTKRPETSVKKIQLLGETRTGVFLLFLSLYMGRGFSNVGTHSWFAGPPIRFSFSFFKSSPSYPLHTPLFSLPSHLYNRS